MMIWSASVLTTKIRVVRHHDDLAPRLRSRENWDDNGTTELVAACTSGARSRATISTRGGALIVVLQIVKWVNGGLAFIASVLTIVSGVHGPLKVLGDVATADAAVRGSV